MQAAEELIEDMEAAGQEGGELVDEYWEMHGELMKTVGGTARLIKYGWTPNRNLSSWPQPLFLSLEIEIEKIMVSS